MMSSSLFSNRGDAAAIPTIEYPEFEKAWEEGACFVVDVREPHEFAAGHIPGALNQPLSDFDPALLPKGKPIVLVCQAGVRSVTAWRSAQAAGVEDIGHYLGGTAGWRRNGGDLDV
jgi:rhodanese-related sulfurtransferase